MLQQRLPNLSREVMDRLSIEEATACLGELQAATRTLDRSGFFERPSWEALQRSDRNLPQQQSLASGNMAGSTIRLPLPSTTFGRR